MKNSKITRFLTSNIIMLIVLLLTSLTVSAEIYQTVSINPEMTEPMPFSSIYSWLGVNWVSVSLIISEICAFLPIKANGIIQGAFKFIGAFFQKAL